MIIITDCLTEKVDEGCIKVANSLSKKLVKSLPSSKLISYGKQSTDAHYNLKLNKLFLNTSLFKILNSDTQSVIYIPFASNTLASILRSIVLCIFTKNKIYSLFALRQKMSTLGKFLIKNSKFNIITLSKQSYDYFTAIANNRVFYLKTGVDLNKFRPVDEKTKIDLRKKYNFDTNKPIILHVGHLHNGRNVGSFLDVDEEKEVVILVSSVSKQDCELRKRLEAKKNIHIIDQYIPNVEEIYNLADVYVFPVIEKENCIDIPLSVLEAVGCGLPIIATRYGELNEFTDNNAFIFLDTIDKYTLNNAINKALVEKKSDRRIVADYDWENSISFFKDIIQDGRK